MSEEQVTQEQSVESNTQETQQQDTQAKLFEIPTEAQDLVGEGKKYSSAEEALRSVPHAQQHIKTLEEEMAQLKEELTKRKTTQELLDEIKSGVKPAENTTQEGKLNQDTIMELVNNTLKQNEQKKTAQTNASQVASKFTEKYGSNAEAVYTSLAKDLNLTPQKLNELAATSPNLVLRLADLEPSVQTNVPKSSGSVNTEALSANKPNAEVSARVPKGASTKDLVSAWKAAGTKVKQ
jgi:vacuolar-type H+-ATPase subunit I/STV1